MALCVQADGREAEEGLQKKKTKTKNKTKQKKTGVDRLVVAVVNKPAFKLCLLTANTKNALF